MGSLHPLVKARLGGDDPARLPDQFSAPTAATVLRDDFNLTTDANGDFCFIDYAPLSTARPTLTAGVLPATFTTVPHAQYTGYTNAARLSRTLLTRVEVVYTGAELETAGYLSVVHRSAIDDYYSATVEGLHNNAELTVRAGKGLNTFGTPMQELSWVSPKSASYMANTIPYICIVGSGLPVSKKVIRIRTYRWVEFIPVEGDLTEGTREHEPHDPGALGVLGHLGASITSHIAGALGPQFTSTVKNLVNAGYHMIQPMMQNYAVPRARQFLMDAYASGSSAAPLLLGM